MGTKPMSLLEEDMLLDLTYDELKTAFRLFDSEGEGFIPVTRFREILEEVDEDFTDSELDDIIAEVDSDGSGTIDFDEFREIMNWVQHFLFILHCYIQYTHIQILSK